MARLPCKISKYCRLRGGIKYAGTKKQSHTCNQILRQSYEYERYLACLDRKQLDAAAQAAFDGISADGAYAGIDYHSRAQTYWQPTEHLKRLLSLTESYVFPEGKFYGSENARDKIICGLVFWQKTHPKSTNWYMQQISTPQDLSVILVLMRFGKSGVPAALEHKILRRMKRTGGKPQNGPVQTGRISPSIICCAGR